MKNLKRFKDFLFESSYYVELELDLKTENKYMEILWDLASLPNVLEKYGISIWVGIADDVAYSYFIEMNSEDTRISRESYNSYKRQYKEAIRKNPKQEKIDSIIKTNLQKCMYWCIKHNVQYNILFKDVAVDNHIA
jgi:hypothetical protein